MTKKYSLTTVICLLSLMLLFSTCSDTPKEPASTLNNIVSSVSLDRYTVNLRDKLFTHAGDNRGNDSTNHIASDSLKAARIILYNHFKDLGLETEYDHYQPYSDFGINVVAELPGSVNPDEIIIVGGHYDSVGNPGACDNASGTAAVMELATVLSQYNFEKTIRFIAWDEEETGMHGSSTYAEAHKTENIIVYLNLDGFGHDGGLHTVVVGSQHAENDIFKDKYIDFLTEYSPEITALSVTENDTSDHIQFQSRGIRNFELYSYGYVDPGNPNYHQPEDNVDTADYIDYNFGYMLIRAAAAFIADQAG